MSEMFLGRENKLFFVEKFGGSSVSPSLFFIWSYFVVIF